MTRKKERPGRSTPRCPVAPGPAGERLPEHAGPLRGRPRTRRTGPNLGGPAVAAGGGRTGVSA
ncbi:hypothetical protein [Streptomyces shenzhenensis]|uniref:hypothetical protein n=1 Tax=Streptomyces shenzhenensis TaxID=943815 RepID=UPI00369CD2CB